MSAVSQYSRVNNPGRQATATIPKGDYSRVNNRTNRPRGQLRRRAAMPPETRK